jgi:hypothetical protein
MNLGIGGKTLGTFGGDKIPKKSGPSSILPFVPKCENDNLDIVCK